MWPGLFPLKRRHNAYANADVYLDNPSSIFVNKLLFFFEVVNVFLQTIGDFNHSIVELYNNIQDNQIRIGNFHFHNFNAKRLH